MFTDVKESTDRRKSVPIMVLTFYVVSAQTALRGQNIIRFVLTQKVAHLAHISVKLALGNAEFHAKSTAVNFLTTPWVCRRRRHNEKTFSFVYTCILARPPTILFSHVC